jgi:hypothetical protein
LAKLRKLARFADSYLDHYLQTKRMKEQSELVRQRQLELAGYNDELRQKTEEGQRSQQLLVEGLKNPALLRRLAKANPEIAPLVPTEAEDVATLAAPIDKATKLEEVPTGEGIFAQARAQTDGDVYSRLMPALAQRDAKNSTLQAQIPFKEVSGINEQGVKTSEFIQENKLGDVGPLAQERTGAQEGERQTDILKGTEKQRFLELSKAENMKASIELDKQKKLITFQLAQQGKAAESKALNEMITAAQQGVMDMNTIAALALEVNSGFSEGAIDTYSAMKGAVEQLPYVGSTLSGAMTATAGVGDRLIGGDPSMARKVNQLEGMRRAAAIKLIRSAGDPRPSDADVRGVMPMIPGSYESIQATQAKVSHMRDMATLLPRVAMANPGVTGMALLNLVDAEAKRLAETRSQTPDRTVENPAKKSALTKLGSR